MKRYLLILSIIAISLSGCASVPTFDTQGVSTQLTPSQVAKNMTQDNGKNVIWGGMILAIINLPKKTQLEILSYPLDSDYRPLVHEQPGGRFLLNQSGYLESAEYSVGRYITVRGNIKGTAPGKIDQADYIYPVLEADKLFLWPKNFTREKPRVQFGIGVMFGQ